MPRPVDLLLGRLAVEGGLATRAQVDAALAAQGRHQPEPPLGVVLVEAGVLTPAQASNLLRMQQEALLRVDARAADRASSWHFGTIVVARGLEGKRRIDSVALLATWINPSNPRRDPKRPRGRHAVGDGRGVGRLRQRRRSGHLRRQ
jgi:hypothetical protein